MAKKTKKKKKVKKKEKSKSKTKSRYMEKDSTKEKIIRILEGSTKFKMDVARVVLKFEPEFLTKLLKDTLEDVKKGRILQISEGTKAIVVLCEDNFVKKMKKEYKEHIIDIRKDLVAYTVMFPKVGSETHGVLAFITTIFAEHGVNLFEVISTYTDITFVIKREDLFKVMDLLGQFIA